MATPALVLVHGGCHASDCWDLTIAEIRSRTDDLTILAIDLPGRRGKPGDLRSLTTTDWVNSVVRDIDEAGLEQIVVVGHSMAGLTVPGVVAKLGASRVREMVLAAAFVPAEGTAVVDTMTGPVATIARRSARRGDLNKLLPGSARHLFLNGVRPDRRKFMRTRFYVDSSRILTEVISRAEMPEDVPRTWILTRRDRILNARAQFRSIAALGGVDEVIEVDSCHDVMVGQPEQLAKILIERCRLWSDGVPGQSGRDPAG